VDQLRGILEKSGANPNSDLLTENLRPDKRTTASEVKDRGFTDDKDVNTNTINEDDETMLNSDRQFNNVLSSDGFSKRAGPICVSSNPADS